MSFDHRNFPNKINLGCGFDKRDGFLNVDLNAFHEPDLVCDVTDLRRLPDGYYEYVLANDILEHILRVKTQNTLKEWNRILKPGGVLELQVPNVIGLLNLLTHPDYQTPEKQEELLQCLFGTQGYDGDFHYPGFTEVYIRYLLESAGFDILQIASKDEWLFVIQARKETDCRVDPILLLDDRQFVTELYYEHLKRAPDESGFQHYLNMLENGAARESLIESIKGSDEYKNAQ